MTPTDRLLSVSGAVDCSSSGPCRGSDIRQRLLFSVGALTGASLATLISQTDVLPSAMAASWESFRQLSLFSDVFEKVPPDYVEPPDEGKLITAAINGMLTSLDPHSSYVSPNEFKTM